MHQIRAHLAYAGAAIVGDEDYGGAPAPAPLHHFFLHASSVRVPLPDGTDIEIRAPLPRDRADALAALGFDEELFQGREPDGQQ